MLNQSAPYFCNQNSKQATMSQIDNYLQLQGAITPEFQQSLSASDAMDLLKAGNDRFVAEEPVKRERQALLERRFQWSSTIRRCAWMHRQPSPN